MVYGDIPHNYNDIEVLCAQSQGYHQKTRNNSGLYALANFSMISNGQEPCKFKLIRNMWGQLREMLSGKYFIFRPFKSVASSPVNDHKQTPKTSHSNTNNFWPKGHNRKELKVNLKRLEDETFLIDCKNRYEILSQLQDLRKGEQQFGLRKGKSKESNEKRAKEKRKEWYEK